MIAFKNLGRFDHQFSNLTRGKFSDLIIQINDPGINIRERQTN